MKTNEYRAMCGNWKKGRVFFSEYPVADLYKFIDDRWPKIIPFEVYNGAGYECCGCIMGDEWHFPTVEAILAHLREHKKQGHKVPGYAIQRLKQEAKEAKK